jgi:hypothetical protein
MTARLPDLIPPGQMSEVFPVASASAQAEHLASGLSLCGQLNVLRLCGQAADRYTPSQAAQGIAGALCLSVA